MADFYVAVTILSPNPLKKLAPTRDSPLLPIRLMGRLWLLVGRQEKDHNIPGCQPRPFVDRLYRRFLLFHNFLPKPT